MRLDAERVPTVYPVFASLEIAEQSTALGDGARAQEVLSAVGDNCLAT